MKTNKLGSSDILVSEICLGTMTWGMQNTEEEGHEQLDYALSRGVNFIDTAEVYPVPSSVPGHVSGGTEMILGRYLAAHQGLREKLVIATKVMGYSPQSKTAAARSLEPLKEGEKLPTARLNAENIISACDASLRRLRTDYIDVYQMHWPDRYTPLWGSRTYDPSRERPSIPFKESAAAFKTLLDAGKIRAWGLSNETTYGVAEFCRAADELGMPRPVTIQNQFCLLNRSFEGELAEACAPSHYNVGLLPWSILAGGALTGKYNGKLDANGDTTDPALSKARLVMYKSFQNRFASKNVFKAIEKYEVIAKSAGMSLTTLAHAFCKSRFYIPSTIIGATTMEQLKENIDAFDVELSPEVLAKCDAVHNAEKDIVHFA